MRKKIGNMLLLCGIAAGLAACGQDAASAKDLAQSINLDAGGSGNAGNGGRAAGETETADRGKTMRRTAILIPIREGRLR